MVNQNIKLVPIDWDYDRDGEYEEPEYDPLNPPDDTDERIARRLGK